MTILLHKPVGYVSGQAEEGYEPAVTLITPANHWDGDRSDTRFSAIWSVGPRQNGSYGGCW